MKKTFLLAGLCVLFFVSTSAQNNNVGIGTLTPNASALLDISSTTKGLLTPRMTKAERDLIATPATGLLVYQTDNTAGFYVYNGTAWTTLGSPSQLEKITENSKTGWRLLGRDAANYGDIGSEAVDLSYASFASTFWGATGNYSTATGWNTVASGESSTAMGAGSEASGTYATAIGYSVLASGPSSTAIGNQTVASGAGATAMGGGTTASGNGATAIGAFTTASGNSATAMGSNTKAPSNIETTMGQYNTDASSPTATSWVVTDRLFTIGNGTTSNLKSNALVTFKNGNTFISNEGTAANTPADGSTSIFTGTTNTAALQVRASGNGMNILTPRTSTGISIAKATIPNATSQIYMSFGHLNTGAYTQIGAIAATAAGTGVSYNTSSDQRLKTDNGTYSKGLSTLNQIKIHDYTWKETQSKEVGVFAQELYKVYPMAVSKGDDKAEQDPTKIEQRWQVDYSKLVPVLVAATQELSAKNEQLEKENAALKAQLAGFADRLGNIEKALNATNHAVANNKK